MRIGLSVCVAGVADVGKKGNLYNKKVWHCPVLVKVGHKPKRKAFAPAKKHYDEPKMGLLTVHGIIPYI